MFTKPILFFIAGALISTLSVSAQFQGPNATAYNPNNGTYYITNTYGKNVVSLSSSGNKSVFISGLNSPNNIIYADLPGLSGFLILDSNEVKAYDDAGSFYASYSTQGAIKFQDIVYDTASQAVFISDVERGVIYKTTFGGPPFYLPSTSIFASPYRRPSAMIIQRDKNRILFVEDTTGGNLMAADLKTGQVSQVKALGMDGLVGLAEDGQGNLYLSSQGTKAIYQLNKYYYGSPKKLYSEPKPGDLFVNIERDQWVYTCIICGTVFTPPLHLFGPGFEVAGCKGDTVISYKHYLQKNIGTFDTGNRFYIELTDPANPGSKPISLGYIQDTMIPDSFVVAIPNGIGSKTYKQRWRSTKPAVKGSSELFTVHLNPLAKIAESDTVQACKGSIVDLGRNFQSGNTYEWSPPQLVDTPTNAFVKHTTLNKTAVYLKVISSEGCRSEDSAMIIPVDNPESGIQTDTVSSCINSHALLGTSAKGGLTYEWTPGTELDDSTLAMPTYSGSADIRFILKVTASGGCSSTDTQYVAKKSLPVFSLVFDSAIICSGKTTMNSVFHSSKNYSIYWVNSFNDTAAGDSRIFGDSGISDTGITQVYFEDLNLGCTANKNVYFNWFPVTQVSIIDNNYRLYPTVQLTSAKWYLNDTLIYSDSNSIAVLKSGNYRICGNDSNGCEICSIDKVFNSNFVKNVSGAAFQIFPNPCAKHLIVRTENHKKVKWQIEGITGKIHKTGDSKEIDVSVLNDGIYFLRLENNQTFQFVKQQL